MKQNEGSRREARSFLQRVFINASLIPRDQKGLINEVRGGTRGRSQLSAGDAEREMALRA
jgi:hypothetical protein